MEGRNRPILSHVRSFGSVSPAWLAGSNIDGLADRRSGGFGSFRPRGRRENARRFAQHLLAVFVELREFWHRRLSGSRATALDIANLESFWSSTKIELLDPKKRKTRPELANSASEEMGIFLDVCRLH